MKKQKQLATGRQSLGQTGAKVPSRRTFVTSSLGLAAGAALSPTVSSAGSSAALVEPTKTSEPSLKITDIEVHEVMLEYQDWIAYQLNHFYGPTKRTVYVAHTNTGLQGLGEGRRESEEVLKKYIGTNPFDWVGDETSLPLAIAMYDLMGKAVGVPVYKLFGQKRRSWVPVGSWTVSTHPSRMAEAVERYSAQGYTWMKFHPSPFESLFDQIEAMEGVAPEDFKIHLDFTQGGTNDHMVDLLERLSASRIVGCFEDPLDVRNISAYVSLRKRSRLPIVQHASPMAKTHEVLMGVADIYMMGHYKIGQVMRRAGLFEAANASFMIQNVGGHITRAMTTHMQAAFPTADFHFFCDAETWKSDVVKERLEPINGFLRVPEAPGLGVTLDRQALDRQKNLQLPEQPRWIIKSQFKNGTKMYNIANPKRSLFMVRPDRISRRLSPMSYSWPISTEYWDDDGSLAYKTMFERIEREGMVLER